MTLWLHHARIRTCVPVILRTLLLVLLCPRWNAVGQTQTPADPCPYRLPHYEEDWTCVHSAAHKAEFLDAIKDVRLGKGGDSNLSFGGEIREAYERFHNPNFGLQPQDPDGYLLQRCLMHIDLHVTESVRGYVELVSALEKGRTGGPRPIVDEDKLDLHQAFLDFDLGQGRSGAAVVRIGRQEIALGSGRLVALREGTNVPFSLDGIRIESGIASWHLDVFGTKPVQNRVGIFDDRPQPGTWFWGVYSSRPWHGGGHTAKFDLYYLGLDRNPAAFNKATAHETRHTIGARAWKLNGAWNYDTEGMFQVGSFGHGNIRAWRVATDISYGLGSSRWQRRMALAMDVASGDRSPASANLGTFNALFQSGLYSGRAQILGPDNTIRIEPSFKASPYRGVLLSAGWGFYWRESIHDGLYGIANNLIVPADGTRARYEGSRPIAQMDWQVNRHLSVHINYIYVFNGPFGEQAIRGTPSMSYVSPWLTYEF
ncbi:MAG TPA: alginate export family protein [Terriglobia bacterium]|nr:alginate export family protein [Terriglobia bacterium]